MLRLQCFHVIEKGEREDEGNAPNPPSFCMLPLSSCSALVLPNQPGHEVRLCGGRNLCHVPSLAGYQIWVSGLVDLPAIAGGTDTLIMWLLVE